MQEKPSKDEHILARLPTAQDVEHRLALSPSRMTAAAMYPESNTPNVPSPTSTTDEERLANIHNAHKAKKEARFKGTIWYTQPFKGLLITYWVATCIFLMPYFYVQALLCPRPRESWTAVTAAKVAFIRRITRLIPLTGFHCGGRDLSKVPTGLKHSQHVWLPPIDEHRVTGFIKAAMTLNGVQSTRAAAFWYGDLSETSDSSGDVVLQLHGGAYILGSAHESEFAAKIFRGLCEHSGYSRVLALDYRLALKHPFPAQMLDALAAYAYLVETLRIPPARITICGDSAGANLALALCRYLRDTSIMPMPGHMLLLSPWCDPTFSYRHVDGSFTKNYKSDIVDVKVTPTAVKFFLGILPDAALHSPLISPITSPETRVFKDVTQLFTSFPRTLILISEGERLWDEALELRDRMTHCQVDVTMHTERDAVHDWLQFDFSGSMSTTSFDAIRKWRSAGVLVGEEAV